MTASYDGQLHCTAHHGPSGQSLETDAPVDNKGRGESFSPTDLVVTALITCIATTLAIRAETLGVELKGMTLAAEKIMSDSAPRRIVEIPVRLTLPPGLPEESRKILLKDAEKCPVSRSLHPDILIKFSGE